MMEEECILMDETSYDSSEENGTNSQMQLEMSAASFLATLKEKYKVTNDLYALTFMLLSLLECVT